MNTHEGDICRFLRHRPWGDWLLWESWNDIRVLVPSRCASKCHLPKPWHKLDNWRQKARRIILLFLIHAVILSLPVSVAADIWQSHLPNLLFIHSWILVWAILTFFLIAIALFVFWNELECRKCRIDGWKEHFGYYSSLNSDSASSLSLNAFKTKIDHLGEHLHVLDIKFSALLTFHSLLVAGLALLLKSNLYIFSPRPTPEIFLAGLLFLSSTFISLRSLSRVRWGDMRGKIQSLEKYADDQIERMIGSVVRRTARLRIAAITTLMNLLLIGTLAITALAFTSIRQLPINPSGKLSITFPSGSASCNDEYTRTEARSFISNMINQGAKHLIILSSADAQPLQAQIVNKYGNNTGLALARGRCVALLLSEELVKRQTFIELTLKVRAPHDRSSGAHSSGDEDDRRVIVQPY